MDNTAWDSRRHFIFFLMIRRPPRSTLFPYTDALPISEAVLVFSFVGYVSQEVPVGNRAQLDVDLQTDTQALGEVVVVGYGTQDRKSTRLNSSHANISYAVFCLNINILLPLSHTLRSHS